MLMRRIVVVAALVGSGCPSAPTSQGSGTKADQTAAKDSTAPQAKPTETKPADPKPADPAPTTDKPPEASGPMGKVLDGAPIPLASFVGAAPADAEKHLGEPLSKGGTKKSCVRFVPERTWFHCEHAWQRYGDPTGTAESIYVTYEDGKVASIAFEKLAGEGTFDPKAALAKVGLELPADPTLKSPAENVKLWSWWNSQSKLLLGGRQYRVEVSSVEDKWDASKVDIILNDPLTDDEKTRMFEVKPQRDGEPTPDEGEPTAEPG